MQCGGVVSEPLYTETHLSCHPTEQHKAGNKYRIKKKQTEHYHTKTILSLQQVLCFRAAQDKDSITMTKCIFLYCKWEQNVKLLSFIVMVTWCEHQSTSRDLCRRCFNLTVICLLRSNCTFETCHCDQLLMCLWMKIPWFMMFFLTL